MNNGNNLGPFGGGSVPDIGQPRASAGQKVTAEHINRGSRAITDNTLRSSDSHEINRSGRGVTLTSRAVPTMAPFRVVGAGNGYLCMTNGMLFNLNSYLQFDIRQWFPSYKVVNGDQMFNRGGEYFIDIKDGNNPACYGTDGQLVANSGQRYASAIFFGMKGGEPWTSTDDMPDDYALYFSFSQGVPHPTLLYKKMSELPSSGVIPVAYVMKNGTIIQVLRGDLMIQSQRWEFFVEVFKENEQWYFSVGYGRIGGVIPKYSDGKYAGDPEGKQLISNVTGGPGDIHNIYVKSGTNDSEPYRFPDPTKCVLEEKPDSSAPLSDNTWSYFMVGSVVFTKNDDEVIVANAFSLARTSQHAIAYKVDATNKTYLYWPMSFTPPP